MDRRDWMPGWILGISGIFLSAGIVIAARIEAVLHPFNQSSWDRFWIAFYIGLFIGVGILYRFRHGRLLIGLTGIALLAFVVISILRGDTGVTWLILAWILAISFGIGDKMLDLVLSTRLLHLENRIPK